MSVDKFGRSYDQTRVAQRGPPGEGFKLTPDGNYNMKFKLITNLGNPAFAEDGVNLGTLEAWVRPCLKDGGDGKFNAKEKIITNLGEPKELTDAVNLGTLAKNCVLYQEKSINVGDRTITRLKDPRGGRDAANKQYVDKAVPTKTDKYWGFGKRRLVNVADPIDDSDVATKKFCTDTESRIKKELSTLTSSTGKWIVAKDQEVSSLRTELASLRGKIDINERKTLQQIRKFGQLLYPRVIGQRGRSATEEQGLTADNYINYEQLKDVTF